MNIRILIILMCCTTATHAYCQEENPFKIVEETRSWNSSDGLYTVRAELKSFQNGVVYLSTTTGKQIEVPIERLSEADQRYVKNEPLLVTDSILHQLMSKVVGVTDGDSITVLDSANAQHKIRLEGIDAPESHQAFGMKSKQALSDKVFGKQVRVDWEQRDKYKRILGHVFLDDRWINKEMVEEGWAWHYKEYSDDEDLAEAEKSSRSERNGLWTDLGTAVLPIPPWDFRHGITPSSSTKPNTLLGAIPQNSTPQVPGNDSTVYITRTGTKYHSGGCSYLSKSNIPIKLSEAGSRYSPCSRCNPPLASTRINSLTGSTPRASATPTQTTANVTVYVTKSGAKYHSGGCRYLSKSQIPISLENARRGYSPCSVCSPPR